MTFICINPLYNAKIEYINSNEGEDKMKKTAKVLFTVITLLIISIYSVVLYYDVSLPDEWYSEDTENFEINTLIPIKAERNIPKYESTFESSDSTENSFQNDSDSTLRLFGIVPIKNIDVSNTERKYLTPGGELYGLKIHIDGVVVTDMGAIDSEDGNICPAEESGIAKGDVIKSISGKKITSSRDIEEVLENSEGNNITISAERNGCDFICSLKPAFSESLQKYEAGMWVRDSTAGIGTVTFYDTESNIFGSLGHPVCDSDTGTFIPFGECETSGVEISGVIKGTVGKTGSIKAEFTSEEGIGSVTGNTYCGVYGIANASAIPKKGQFPIGYKQEVHTGKAEIYCTVYGDTAEKYEIEIKKIDLDSDEKTKDMIIKVTDKSLLEKTGGIVCGMSGSPIIQDGKLIGAVTHVFVKDPTEGYAIFCEDMLNEMSIG